jgi:hypothetical protein
MLAMTTAVLRPRVALGLDKENVPALIVGGKTIHTKLVENAATFPNANPPVDVLLQQLTALEEAERYLRSTRASGAAAARDVARTTFWGSLQSEKAMVQTVVEAHPYQAESIAAMAGMRLAKNPTRNKEILQVVATTVRGTVRLKANAKQLVASGKGKAKKRTYLWRYSIDGGTTWIGLEGTPVATVEIRGLPPTTDVMFQVTVKDSAGTGAWSQAITFFVR